MLRRFIAVLAMVVPLAIGAAAIPAHANATSQKNGLIAESAPVVLSLDGTWSCSVPSGYTWDWVQVSNSCGSLRYQYRLRTPVNGLWACSIPMGWAYDAIQPTNLCGSNPYYYRLVG
ncbi:hypothetical protein GA0070618_1544 [Micromonospora echinospora]|uniref:Secreted protein n=1 Tax=Micromonospora echinospora TaxID=1877 RepID=A0A1C4VTS7_MICEC|nr:hypothetical protein [Micromonospora echinospora]SCE87225.1 hypothetical protein GA0070618_1544 [Micromonospora echinospora]